MVANRTGIEKGEVRACSLDSPDYSMKEAEDDRLNHERRACVESRTGSEPTLPVSEKMQDALDENKKEAKNGLVCEEARYAGTSVVMGLGGGRIKVWGILGRASEGVLVVDTDEAPRSVLVMSKADTS